METDEVEVEQRVGWWVGGSWKLAPWALAAVQVQVPAALMRLASESASGFRVLVRVLPLGQRGSRGFPRARALATRDPRALE